MSPPRKREAVGHVVTVAPVTERRACRAIGQIRSSARFVPRPDLFRESLRQRIIALAKEYGFYVNVADSPVEVHWQRPHYLIYLVLLNSVGLAGSCWTFLMFSNLIGYPCRQDALVSSGAHHCCLPFCLDWIHLCREQRARTKGHYTRHAAIRMASPVRGFRPVRGSLLRTVNLPKPGMVTGSPF